jgi:putative transcriptional regulator
MMPPWRKRPLSAALGALLCACALSWPTAADDARKPLTAILLVAQIPSNDPFFSDSIVLVMNNLGPSPVGIIINRPTAIAVAHLFPDNKRLGQLPDKVYFGGPVEIETVWFLFRAATPPEHALRAFDGICLSANRELLLRLLARDKPMDGLRIFVGHAGWGPGQLEAEIARGDWTMKHAEADAVFNGKSEHPWPAAPARDGGI